MADGLRGRRVGRSGRQQAGHWLRRGATTAATAALVLAGVAGSARVAGPAGAARAGVGAPAAPPAAPAQTATGEPSPPPPVLADGTAGGQTPTAAGVARALGVRLADRRLGARLTAQVVDADTGAVLLDHGGDTPSVPASTAKLTTAAAVLAVLRPDDRIVTRVVAGATPGEVVLVGGGDPTLSAAPPGTPTVYGGAARLATLAAAVRKATRARVTRVLLDGSRFTGPRLGPGWNPADVAGGYIAPITAVMADGGRGAAGQLARSTEPDVTAGRALATYLGVPVASLRTGRAGAGAQVLAQVGSAPVIDLVEQMLLASDNVLAEALARQVAVAEGLPASFAGAADAVRQVLGRLGVPIQGERLVDGSGLSSRNRITPAVLVAVLRAALSADHPALHALVPGLPVGGYDGTLERRYASGPAAAAAGSVRAKTGTLDGVSSLAGLVSDRDGRLLVFAFVANGVPVGGTLAADAALDSAAAALAGCGCR